MKKTWAALAAITALTAMPVMAQTGMTTTSMTYTNTDTTKVRDGMDKLRTYLDRMQDNTRLQFASGDLVQADGYRRMNVVLLDNATALAMNVSSELGPATSVQPGWGLVRNYIADVNAHLAHARLVGDYTIAIDQASNALTKANEAMTQSSSGMSGSMSNMGTNMNR